MSSAPEAALREDAATLGRTAVTALGTRRIAVGKTLRLAAGLAVVWLLASCSEPEAVFPARPIDIVTHASPGGGTDATARTMLVGAREALAADMAVLFKGGGGGVVAMSYAAGQPRDGHTLLAITPTHLYAIARGQGPLQIADLIPVARATDDPLVVSVRGAGPIETLDDLIALGRQRPIKWGTGLIGGGDHAAGVSLARAAGTELSVVPFAGGGEAATQLLGGSIDAAGLNLTEALDLFDNGDLRPLAVMAEERIEALADVPTTVELGYDVTFSTVRGYVVLRGTPEDRIEILERGLLAGMQHPAFQRYLRNTGLSPRSIAGRAVWGAQLERMYRSARAGLAELGMTAR